MLAPTQLTGAHRRTYDAIFRHPLSHTIPWREVHQLFREIAQVEEQPNGNLRITRNGESTILKPAKTRDVSDASDLMALRHFLEKSEAFGSGPTHTESHCVVVIDHRMARVFHSDVRGTVPGQVLPRAPEDYFRHAHHSQDFSRGKEKPDLNSYFEPVARELAGTKGAQLPPKILLFGNGKGMASEMDQFKGWLAHHHPELFGRIVGALPIDEHHLSDDQLLAKAREFFASLGTSVAPSL